uniref:Uncharacterized protein n=1 Tax=Meloidogyne enterolobii TaxID=390850 RepID=A0A6V7XHT0_MELEN|nr:unnamed protein product [Meloidogyne enterolobii]
MLLQKQNKTKIKFLAIFTIYWLINLSNQEESKNLPKVTILKMSTEEGFQMYEQWINKAFASLLSAFLQSKINSKELPQKLPENFSKCFLKTESIPSMTKCISQLLEGKFNENNKIYTKRLQRYLFNKGRDMGRINKIKTRKEESTFNDIYEGKDDGIQKF